MLQTMELYHPVMNSNDTYYTVYSSINFNGTASNQDNTCDEDTDSNLALSAMELLL